MLDDPINNRYGTAIKAFLEKMKKEKIKR